MWRIAFLTALSVLALTMPTTAMAKIAAFGFALLFSMLFLIAAAIGDAEKLLNDLRQKQDE